MSNLDLDHSEESSTGHVASDPNETREEFIMRMAEEGYIPRYPSPNELLIDIDNDTHWEAFVRSFDIFKREYPLEQSCKIYPSRSGLPCRHVIVQLPFKIDDWQRIALQAALGSDPVRELLSILRLQRGDAHPTMFIEKEENV